MFQKRQQHITDMSESGGIMLRLIACLTLSVDCYEKLFRQRHVDACSMPAKIVTEIMSSHLLGLDQHTTSATWVAAWKSTTLQGPCKSDCAICSFICEGSRLAWLGANLAA